MKTYRVLGEGKGTKFLSPDTHIFVDGGYYIAHTKADEEMIEGSDAFRLKEIFEVNPDELPKTTLEQTYMAKMREYGEVLPDELIQRLAKMPPEGKRLFLEAAMELADHWEGKTKDGPLPGTDKAKDSIPPVKLTDADIANLNDQLDTLMKEDDILQEKHKTAQGEAKRQITLRIKAIVEEMKSIQAKLPATA